MRTLFVLLAALLAFPAAAEDRPYRLPGDPDTMVRRGPAVTPAPTPEASFASGNRAARVGNVPPSTARRDPGTRLTVTREVFYPYPRIHYPDPRWRLRIRRENGEWSGDFVLGHPGWGDGWGHRPAPDTRRSARAGRPGGG